MSGCVCDGSGKIVRRIDHSDEPWRDIGGGMQIAEVSLAVEVPISDDNYVVHRRGDNVYYPVSVQLHVTSAELNWLFPDEARALAAALVKAADRAEELDGPLAQAVAEEAAKPKEGDGQSVLSS